jgi:cyanophycin synthetase
MVESGDCTGSISSRFVLKDPTVDFAVLECARGGMLKSGLGFDMCDVGIVTNVAEDHIGLQDIVSIEQMAKVKSVVAESVSPTGYAVLNADDALVIDMRHNTKANIALFSMDSSNPHILEHCENGGLAAYVHDSAIYIQKGYNRKKVADLDQIPLTFKGKAGFMVQNVLAAVIAAYVQKFKMDEIRLALQTFVPSAKLTPGRLNIFEFPKFKVMVDFAHYAAGIEALTPFIDSLDEEYKVGIIAGVGDRRDIDIFNMGAVSAQLFDEIIIRLDKDLRGRTAEEIIAMVKKGIDHIDPTMNVSVIEDSIDATNYAIDNAREGAFITICTEKISEQIKLITERQEEFKTKHSEKMVKKIKPKAFSVLSITNGKVQARA